MIAGSHYAVAVSDTDDDEMTVIQENHSHRHHRRQTSVGNSTISSIPTTGTATAAGNMHTPERRFHFIATTPQKVRSPIASIKSIDLEENPSMLTATDDEFSFHSHPSRQEELSFEEEDDDDENGATAREFTGATVAGALAGLVLAGPLGAVAVGASSAYVVSSHSPAGKLVRKGGESVARVGDQVLQSKPGKASLQRGELAIARARKLFKNEANIPDGVKERRSTITFRDLRQRALCCGSVFGSSPCGDDKTMFDATVDDDSFVLQRNCSTVDEEEESEQAFQSTKNDDASVASSEDVNEVPAVWVKNEKRLV